MKFGDRDRIGRNIQYSFDCPPFYVSECILELNNVFGGCLPVGPGSQEQEGQKPAIIK